MPADTILKERQSLYETIERLKGALVAAGVAPGLVEAIAAGEGSNIVAAVPVHEERL